MGKLMEGGPASYVLQQGDIIKLEFDDNLEFLVLILDLGTSMIGMLQDFTNLKWLLICSVLLGTWSSLISTGEDIFFDFGFDMELDINSVSFFREINKVQNRNIQWAPLITL